MQQTEKVALIQYGDRAFEKVEPYLCNNLPFDVKTQTH